MLLHSWKSDSSMESNRKIYHNIGKFDIALFFKHFWSTNIFFVDCAFICTRVCQKIKFNYFDIYFWLRFIFVFQKSFKRMFKTVFCTKSKSICVLVLWIQKGYFAVKKSVWNVHIKAFWYTKIIRKFLDKSSVFLIIILLFMFSNNK